jgi:hypothetical protein
VVKKTVSKEKIAAVPQEKQPEVAKPAIVINESTSPQQRIVDTARTNEVVGVVNAMDKKEDTTAKMINANGVTIASFAIDTTTVALQKQVVDTMQKSQVQQLERPAIVESATITPSSTLEEPIPYKRSTVLRRSESSTSEGFGLTFVDQYDGGSDTVRLLIPNPTYSIEG